MKLSEMLKDDSVTLFTLEGQLKVCGCLIVMIVAIAGMIASCWAIVYSVFDWRKQELHAYASIVKEWNLEHRIRFEDL